MNIFLLGVNGYVCIKNCCHPQYPITVTFYVYLFVAKKVLVYLRKRLTFIWVSTVYLDKNMFWNSLNDVFYLNIKTVINFVLLIITFFLVCAFRDRCVHYCSLDVYDFRIWLSRRVAFFYFILTQQLHLLQGLTTYPQIVDISMSGKFFVVD